MIRHMITVKGKRYVLVPPAELKRLEKNQIEKSSDALPPWPPTDAAGNQPAVAFARVSIARTIIQQRHALGLTQEKLARLAGVRVETISRIEAGKHSPTVRTVEKIDRALKRAGR